MGLSIGQTEASVAAVRPENLAQPNRRGTAPSSEGRADAAGESGTLGQPQQAAEERVLSTAGAALRTLEDNFQSVRRLVPSISELNEETRAELAAATRARAEVALRRAEQLEALEEGGAPQPAQEGQQNGAPVARVESVRPEPSPQVRNFETDEPPAPPTASSVERPEAAQGPAPEAFTPSRIDVLV